jgi:hypothetical protein
MPRLAGGSSLSPLTTKKERKRRTSSTKTEEEGKGVKVLIR